MPEDTSERDLSDMYYPSTIQNSSQEEAIEKMPMKRQNTATMSVGMGSWISRNTAKVSLLAAMFATFIVAAIVVPIVVFGMDNSHPSSNHRDLADIHPDVGSFDDSARPNTITPPLKEPFAYGKQPIRGVNLGGWLVLEPFITPSLFDQFPPSDHIVDEWTLCAKLGPEEAKRQLEHHYQTFVTEDDFQKMAKMGLNHVRIPIGHWAVEVFEGEPFVPKVAWKYLLKGIQWARKYGLRVMVELHTAPGSQNGWNHSGRYGQIGWLNGTNGEENGKRTLKIVEQMITFFNKPEWDHVTPIFGVLNEPAIFMLDKARVKDWYRESYDAIRNITGPDSGPILTYHEGFLGLTPWAGFFNTGYYRRVILETHTYLIFDKNLVSLPRNDQAIFACGSWQNDLKKSAEMNGPTMVGEFSAATNDCGKYLNGVGLGTRYEGTYRENTGEIRPPVCSNCTCKGVEDWKTWTDDYKHFLKAFIERQMDAFEASYGWLFWTYKTENHINPHWDYLLGWEQGWMPADANHRTFSCSDLNAV